MKFAVICLVMLAVLGIVAALATVFSKGGTSEPIRQGEDCTSCSSAASGDCKIGCLIKEKRSKEIPNAE